MRRPLVAGNWKMNGTRESAVSLAAGIVERGVGGDAEVAVCPPYVHVDAVGRVVRESPIRLGAQNVAREESGAFTGEIAAPMLLDLGCSLVLVGHSERRSLYGETDALVAEKFVAARGAGLVPVLCVGESLDERESGRTEAVVARQLDAVVSSVGVEALADGIIAYEPVWAIGTGRTASPDQAQAVHAYLRERLAGRDARVAAAVRILYGGSVKPDNARELFSCPDIDGGLIGGASLDPAGFAAICEAAGG